MRTGYILFFLIFLIFLEGCYCVANHQKKEADLQKNYRAVEGETFMIPCINCSIWHMESVRLTEGVGGGDKDSLLECGNQFTAEEKHSGNYSCHTGSSKFLRLQVVGSFQPNKNTTFLVAAAAGDISCPGLSHGSNTDVTWYKGDGRISDQKRKSSQHGGELLLHEVTELDCGVYFCDRQIDEEGITWTFRRAVKVKVILQNTPPTIPAGDTTEEVEIGQPHTLSCKAHFRFEENFSPKMEWYMNIDGNMTLLDSRRQNSTKEVSYGVCEVIQVAVIKEVMPQHLKYTYTCIASNTLGNDTATVKLKRKLKVYWPSLVGYPVASFLLVAGLGIILHVKWLEIQLIYRSYFQNGKHDEDEKEYDVFLSYVWSPSSAEVAGGINISSRSPYSDEEDPLNNEEGNATQRPLEVLLPQVLEDQWGYRLFLLERDVLPGGGQRISCMRQWEHMRFPQRSLICFFFIGFAAYTNDVVLAIKRSRMLICVLSDDYLANSNAVFELESGVQALLQKSAIKLLLLWTNKASAALMQPDPPLSMLVRRALRVLPGLDWTSGKNPSNFWRSLGKAMPRKRVVQKSYKF